MVGAGTLPIRQETIPDTILIDLEVNVFLGKPYKEEELLNHLSGLIP